MANQTILPTYTGVIDQRYLIEPLNGPQNPVSYLDRFPDELYSKTLDSHLVRFLYALLGPAGIGGLHANYLRARLLFEEHGIELSDLESFYGSPFQFGRIFSEFYDADPSGVLTQAEWDLIRAKDASYRSRAIDFFNGARAGTSPEGMRLVARSGLGHDVQIIENYQFLFDQHSDDQLGLKYYGKTLSTEEFIVVPRREATTSEVQQVTIESGTTGGNFQLGFRGAFTGAIGWTTPDTDASALVVQAALEALPTIGVGNVKVAGGPTLIDTTLVVVPYQVSFTGQLASQDVPLLDYINNLTDSPQITIDTITNGVDPSDEIVDIPAVSQHELQVALDRIKPVTAITSVYMGEGLRRRQTWAQAISSVESIEVLRYVTGQAGVIWPSSRPYQWIQKNVEKQGPRAVEDLDRHYQGFHNISAMTASSLHIGRFSEAQIKAIPYLGIWNDDALIYTADRAVADYSEPLTVTATIDDNGTSVGMIQGIYPVTYLGLAGVPDVRYKDDQFWSSAEASEGSETLIVDLGTAQAVNTVQFEIIGKPLTIAIDYDVVDNGTDYVWQPVVPVDTLDYPNSVGYTPENQNPWVATALHFVDGLGCQIFTRYIRLTFARTTSAPFIAGAPYSVEVRNLRVGRNVS